MKPDFKLEIIEVDGTYAEGLDSEGNLWAIHAGGNGDFRSHKVDFVLLSLKSPD